jgi:hypothetical protein
MKCLRKTQIEPNLPTLKIAGALLPTQLENEHQAYLHWHRDRFLQNE